jgi:HSP20 family protein
MAHMTRWNPVRELISMREAMDRLFEETSPRIQRTAFALPMDAYTTEDAIVLVADVPGLKPEQLEVTLEGDTLVIRGELNPNTENRSYLLRERLSGKFERTLTINTPIDSARVEATFADGVLTLTLPKAEAVKPRQITVKAQTNASSSAN